MSEGAAPTLSYASFFSTLASIGEKVKKNRRNAAKFASEMDQLLFAVVHHNMHSVSPSSRIVEAQAWMCKAVVEKTAGRPDDEARAYLAAADIWFAVERERKDMNFPTSDDALARGVLCAGMACGVLLAQRPPVASSPLPLKMTQMGNVHLSRCWGILMRVATVLREFSCFEMAADFFELAAVVITTEQHCTSGGDGAETGSNANASFAAMPGLGASFAMRDSMSNLSAALPFSSLRLQTGGISTASAAGGAHQQQHGGAASPARSTRSRSTITGAFQPSRQTSATFTEGDASGTNTSVPRTTSTATAGNAFAGAPAATASTGSGAPGEAAAAGGDTPNATRSVVHRGFAQQYAAAMSACAATCALIQDYPRALGLLDELLLHAAEFERQRRPEDFLAAFGAAAGDASGAAARTTDDACDPARKLLMADVLGAADNGSSSEATAPSATAAAAAASGTAEVMTEPHAAPSTASNASVTQPPGPEVVNTSHLSSSSAPPPPQPGPSPTQQRHGFAAAAPSIVAPALPFTAAEHYHHLVEMEAEHITARVAKFFILVIVREEGLSLLGCQEQIAALHQLAGLYRRHERTTRAARRRFTGSGASSGATSSANVQSATADVTLGDITGAASGSPAASRRASSARFSAARAASAEMPESDAAAAAPVTLVEQPTSFAATLVRLATALEIVLEVSEVYGGTCDTRCQEALLRGALDDVEASLAAMGMRTRCLAILAERMRRGIVDNRAADLLDAAMASCANEEKQSS